MNFNPKRVGSYFPCALEDLAGSDFSQPANFCAVGQSFKMQAERHSIVFVETGRSGFATPFVFIPFHGGNNDGVIQPCRS